MSEVPLHTHHQSRPPGVAEGYRGTSLIRNSAPLGPYSRTMPRTIWRPLGGGAVSYERGTPVTNPHFKSHARIRSGTQTRIILGFSVWLDVIRLGYQNIYVMYPPPHGNSRPDEMSHPHQNPARFQPVFDCFQGPFHAGRLAFTKVNPHTNCQLNLTPHTQIRVRMG